MHKFPTIHFTRLAEEAASCKVTVRATKETCKVMGGHGGGVTQAEASEVKFESDSPAHVLWRT